MAFTARSLVDLTDDLLVTEQELPRWLRAAWADALAGAPAWDPDSAAASDDR